MDRIEKALFVLPLLPLVDMVATLFSITFGGQEAGVVAKPIYERYGELGLVVWSIFLFLLFLVCVWGLRILKKRFMVIKILRQASKTERLILVIPVTFAFAFEAWWTGAIVQNLLVPVLRPPFELYVIWSIVAFTYFVLVSFFTRTEIRRIIRR